MVGLGDVIKDLNQYTLRSVHPEAADGAACFSEQWWRELVSGYRFPSACAHVGPCSRVWDLSPAFLVALSISLSLWRARACCREKKMAKSFYIDLLLPRYQRRSVAGTCGRGTCGGAGRVGSRRADVFSRHRVILTGAGIHSSSGDLALPRKTSALSAPTHHGRILPERAAAVFDVQ